MFSEAPTLVYLTKPQVENMKIIASHIKESRIERNYIVVFCPRYTVLCKEALENEEVNKDN
jgi:hypothetical protein